MDSTKGASGGGRHVTPHRQLPRVPRLTHPTHENDVYTNMLVSAMVALEASIEGTIGGKE